MHMEAGVGHIGGNLSALELLMTVHHALLREGDVFVLSKGHAAGGLYVTLWSCGLLTEDDLATFHRDGTLLAGHPPPQGLPGVSFATGSLGHGLPLACGLALSRRLRGQSGRVWCLSSDGEWDEGSTWEAVIFARQQRLSNLTVLVDANGLQGFGATADIADLGRLAHKLREFGWEAEEGDGHDIDAIADAGDRHGTAPRAIVAATVKGRGVSFMEGRFEWHYLPLTADLYTQAVREVGGTSGERG